MTDYTRLAELAAATPAGPWVAVPGRDEYETPVYAPTEGEDPDILGLVYQAADARFIAAANPTVVLGLLAALDGAAIDAIDVDSLEVHAHAASSMQWRSDGSYGGRGFAEVGVYAAPAHGGKWGSAGDIGVFFGIPEADYIAAADPEAVLSIIGALRSRSAD